MRSDLEQERRGGGEGMDAFRFTMLFDEMGRLALGQPGSGFKPLVVSMVGVWFAAL